MCTILGEAGEGAKKAAPAGALAPKFVRTDVDPSSIRLSRARLGGWPSLVPDVLAQERKPMKLVLAAAIVFLALGRPLVAQDIVVGLGLEEARAGQEGNEPLGVLEYWGAPFADFGRAQVHPGFAAQIDGAGDVWLGPIVAGTYEFGSRLFAEASLGAGYYGAETGGSDLGLELQFRSLVGVGAWLGQGWGVSLAIDHKSNGGLSERNPGSNQLSLRLRRRF